MSTPYSKHGGEYVEGQDELTRLSDESELVARLRDVTAELEAERTRRQDVARRLTERAETVMRQAEELRDVTAERDAHRDTLKELLRLAVSHSMGGWSGSLAETVERKARAALSPTEGRAAPTAQREEHEG